MLPDGLASVRHAAFGAGPSACRRSIWESTHAWIRVQLRFMNQSKQDFAVNSSSWSDA
jgi:hypothetical protein